jgi:hypothetical protein
LHSSIRGGFEQTLRQVAMSVHGAPEYDLSGAYFVKKDMLSKRTKNQKVPPCPQFRVSKPPKRTQHWLLGQQSANSFHGVEIAIGYFPSCI